MKSIIRSYVILTTVILSLTFLVTGIISVNEETSYVISGERQDVLKVQSTTSERLLVRSGNENDTKIMSFGSEDIKSTLTLLSGILPSPFAQIVWAGI